MPTPHQSKYAGWSSLLLLAVSAAGARAADSTVAVKLISETGAQQVVASAEQQARKLNAPCAIAIVDGSGILVAFVKMDGVRDGSPDLAIGKARTSALLQRPSAETETNIDKGRMSFITAGFVSLRGGMPLTAGGQVVGAVGVASLSKENDVTISEAAAAAFAAANGPPPAGH